MLGMLGAVIPGEPPLHHQSHKCNLKSPLEAGCQQSNIRSDSPTQRLILVVRF